MKRIRHSNPILPAALLIGFAANLLFNGKPLGISMLLFALLFVAVLFYLGRRSATEPARRNLWILAPLFFFAAMVAIRDNAFLTTLNVLAVSGLLTYLVLYYATGRPGDTGLLPALLLPVYTIGKSLPVALPIIKETLPGSGQFRHSRTNMLAISRGVILAAPLLLVFTILLALADTLFAKAIIQLINLSNIQHLFDLCLQALFILGISWLATGGLFLALDDQDHAADFNGRFFSFRRLRFLGFTESTTILTLVNLLFLSFVIIQFRYLFGGLENVDYFGFTYAEYARRGFFELLAVAMLSLGLILGIEAVTWRESKGQFKIFNLQSGLLISLVIIILISAFQRMRLYEATYGYTELRLYVYLFMVWLALFLVWFLIGLFHRPDRFTLGPLLLIISFLVILNLLNPDAFIVRQNMARYWAGGDLDLPYLESLSADAVPALVKARSIAASNTGFPCQAGSGDDLPELCGPELAQRLQAGLRERYLIMHVDSKGSIRQSTGQGLRQSPWQSTNLSRWRSQQLLFNLFP